MTAPFSKEQLDLLYGKDKDLVFLMKQTTESYRYEYVNPKCREVFRKELIGTLVDDSMPAALAEEIKKQYKIALDARNTHTYRDYNLFTKHKIAIETEVKPIICDDGQYILAISRNVTKQKKVEEDYLFYQSLIENSVDPMIMITAEYRIFDMNPAYESIFGIDKRDWLDRPYKSLPFIGEEIFNDMLGEFESVVSGNQTSSSMIKRRKADGKITGFSASYSPISSNGKVRAIHMVLREMTSEVLLKNELKYTENILESYKDALNYAALVAIWKLSGRIQFANNNFKGLTGYEREELMGMHIADISKSIISDDEYNEIRKVILSKEIWRGEIKCLDKNGRHFWVSATIIPMTDPSGRIYEVLSIMFDITDRKQMEEKLHFMAYHDSLTGLPNRRMMMDQFDRLKLRSKESVALLFIDGDDFKQINDLFGHDTGDEFIFNFGQAIQKSIRTGDLAARMGGDEFLVTLPGIEPGNAEKQVAGIIGRIKKNLETGWTIGEHYFSPTCSIGVAFYPEDAEDFETLVQKADAALYQAKEKGKNQLRFYNENWH